MSAPERTWRNSYRIGVGVVSQNNVPSGNRTITIAPNILKAMAKDPEVATKYEEFLADYERTAIQFDRMRAARGQETLARGVFINPDGTCGCYVSGQDKGGGNQWTEFNSLAELLEKAVERRAVQAEQREKLREAQQTKKQTEQEPKTEVSSSVSMEIKVDKHVDYFA
ncbi:MAG: DUF6033 family protein [Planctomycetes bacterium]|nr:DUF6033 family protein [Planctomycetota bacterium]